MPHLLLGRNNKQLASISLHWRIRCWLRGGHSFYYNTELGGMWCMDCQGVWYQDPKVSGK